MCVQSPDRTVVSSSSFPADSDRLFRRAVLRRHLLAAFASANSLNGGSNSLDSVFIKYGKCYSKISVIRFSTARPLG